MESEGALTRKKLSAIIACYRDAPAVPIMHERLTADIHEARRGLRDHLRQRLQPGRRRGGARGPRGTRSACLVINHTRNFGSQSAFTSGMPIATGDAVILLDGDLQDPPEMIAPFYPKWREGYDVVYGIRVKREATPFLRVAYKALLSRLSHDLVRADPPRRGRLLPDRPAVVNALNSLPENNRFMRGLRAWVASGRPACRTCARSACSGAPPTPDEESRLGPQGDLLLLVRAARFYHALALSDVASLSRRPRADHLAHRAPGPRTERLHHRDRARPVSRGGCNSSVSASSAHTSRTSMTK